MPPAELQRHRGWAGKQTENRWSHWIWRQYASSHWLDVRLGRVLPYRGAKDPEDEKHVHPLQLDVVDRAVTLWSNPGETVLSPFAGVGTEVYSPLHLGRRGIGIELKPSYYRQAVRNCRAAEDGRRIEMEGAENEAMDFDETDEYRADDDGDRADGTALFDVPTGSGSRNFREPEPVPAMALEEAA